MKKKTSYTRTGTGARRRWTPHNHKHILLALSIWDDAFHRGVIRYAKDALWKIDAHLKYDPHPKPRRYDGIIAGYISEGRKTPSQAVVDQIKQANVPVLNLDPYNNYYNTVTLGLDVEAAVRMFTTYFAARGFRHLAVYPCGTTKSSSGKQFSAKLQPLMRQIHKYIVGSSIEVYGIPEGNLLPTLEELPKPLAVYCRGIYTAPRFCDICREANIRIPEQVAVLSAFYNKLFCAYGTTPISGIEWPEEQSGFDAAAMLDDMMNGKKFEQDQIRQIQPLRIIEAQSTNMLAIDNPHLAAAVAFMRGHFCELIQVSDILEQSDISSRYLQQLFRVHFGHSISEELEQLRIGRVKKLLLETDGTLEQIAHKSGFSGKMHLYRAFKRITGLPPGAWRHRWTAVSHQI